MIITRKYLPQMEEARLSKKALSVDPLVLVNVWALTVEALTVSAHTKPQR